VTFGGTIPEDAIVEERFLAATGPDGQNVNKEWQFVSRE